MGKGLTTRGTDRDKGATKASSSSTTTGAKSPATNGSSVATAVDPTIEIGSAAGEVYRYLHENGEVSMTKLRKELELNGSRVDQALGWLAREEKILLTKDRRTVLVSLRID